MKLACTLMALLGWLGFLMLVGVATANTYVVFFAERAYTPGMFAVSLFWTGVGGIFLSASTRGLDHRVKEQL